MATELGQAYVQIMPSAKGISGSIQKELDPEATTAGKSAGNKIGAGIKLAGAAAVAAAGIALGKIISSSITEGAALQQSLGGVETLFKENADKVKQYANEAYRTAGLSANDYMQNVTSFSASLLQSLGGDTSAAADKANTAMIDMSDNANKFGSDMQDIQNAYQGFAKQNYTMLDNLKLGYGGTKSEMERLLSDAEKLTGVKYDINNLADVYDAIHAVQTELGVTGTTAKEAAETLSGSLASMKGAFSNVLGNLALGQDITPSLQGLAETVSTFLFDNLLPMVGNILKALPGALVTFIQAAAPHFIEAGEQFVTQLKTGITGGLPKLIESAGNIINNFVAFLMENLPLILTAGKDLLLNLVDGIIQNLPTIIDSAIQVISNFIDIVVQNLPNIVKTGIEVLISLIGGIISRLPEIIATAIMLVTKFIAMIISKLPDIVGAGVKIIGSIVSGIGQVAFTLFAKGAELMGGLMDKINEWKSKFFEAGKNIVTSIADGIRGAVGKVKSAIGDVVQTVRNYLPFSPAKEGPLKDLNKLDFTIIADGIYNAKRPIANAMHELTKSTLASYDAVMDVNADTNYKTGSGAKKEGDWFAKGGNIIIEKMEVRSDNDILSIANELYNLQRVKSRVGGVTLG